jgi:hypothetical protein
MLTRLVGSAIAASLLFACAPAASPAPPPRLDGGYLVIQPDVSVSRNARPAIAKNVTVDERADIMAEILAIPPGR